MSCRSGKNRYPDEVAARAALVLIGARIDDTRRKMPCRVYRCESCRGWHLTSKPRGRR